MQRLNIFECTLSQYPLVDVCSVQVLREEGVCTVQKKTRPSKDQGVCTKRCSRNVAIIIFISVIVQTHVTSTLSANLTTVTKVVEGDSVGE